MRDLKRMVLGISLLVLALTVVACGSSTSPSSSSSPSPTKAPSSPTASASSAVLIKTAVVSVNGKPTTILTNAQGRTLYYSTSDTATKVACIGACAKIWPALLFTGTGLPTSATPLQGKVSVVTTANGQQVEYNGHPLYLYSLDTAAGQTHGEGFKGVWFVVPPNLASQSAS